MDITEGLSVSTPEFSMNALAVPVPPCELPHGAGDRVIPTGMDAGYDPLDHNPVGGTT